MTEKKMLVELINLAQKNGCLSVGDRSTVNSIIDWSQTTKESWYGANCVSVILFQHKFAKAIFGTCSLGLLGRPCPVGNCHCADGWQYQLSRLAVVKEDERIEYAYKNCLLHNYIN